MAQSISQEAIGATGLPGATAASRHAGATTSGAPTTGTFAVGDYVVDQTGKIYVCTVAGTPGTWVQTGGGTYAPGTTVSSWITSNVALTSAFPTKYTITSITLTAGTWLVNIQGFWIGGNCAVEFAAQYGTTQITIAAIYNPNSPTSQYMSCSGAGSVTLASTTTINLVAYASAAGTTVYASGNFFTGYKNTGITAVQTA